MKCVWQAGRWYRPRGPVKSNVFGCLVVKPTCWELQLRKQASPSFRIAYAILAANEPVRVLAKERLGKVVVGLHTDRVAHFAIGSGLHAGASTIRHGVWARDFGGRA